MLIQSVFFASRCSLFYNLQQWKCLYLTRAVTSYLWLWFSAKVESQYSLSVHVLVNMNSVNAFQFRGVTISENTTRSVFTRITKSLNKWIVDKCLNSVKYHFWTVTIVGLFWATETKSYVLTYREPATSIVVCLNFVCGYWCFRCLLPLFLQKLHNALMEFRY